MLDTTQPQNYVLNTIGILFVLILIICTVNGHPGLAFSLPFMPFKDDFLSGNDPLGEVQTFLFILLISLIFICGNTEDTFSKVWQSIIAATLFLLSYGIVVIFGVGKLFLGG